MPAPESIIAPVWGWRTCKGLGSLCSCSRLTVYTPYNKGLIAKTSSIAEALAEAREERRSLSALSLDVLKPSVFIFDFSFAII